MKITNVANLPAAIVSAIQNDPYEAGDCDSTVTRLIQPSRKVALERQHKDEISEDVADRIWALLGQLGHSILERAGIGIVEHRFTAPCRGWKIGGKADVVDGNKILDWKFTSVWSCKDGVKSEWVEQLNLLAYLAAKNGFAITSLEVTAIYRDWSKLEARRSPDYPRHQVHVFDVPLWPLEKAESWINERVQAHQAAQAGELPECTPAERWEKPEMFALMKTGRQRAVRLYDNRQDAEKAAEGNDALRIEHRPGEQVRCQSYCAARPFCVLADKLGVPKD